MNAADILAHKIKRLNKLYRLQADTARKMRTLEHDIRQHFPLKQGDRFSYCGKEIGIVVWYNLYTKSQTDSVIVQIGYDYEGRNKFEPIPIIDINATSLLKKIER